jgi:hypothetical protein
MTRDWKSGSRPRWDTKDEIASEAAGSLSLRRLVGVTAFLLLIGLMGWLLYSLLTGDPVTQIVAVRVKGYQTLTIKPIPFLAADTDAMLELPELAPKGTTLASQRVPDIDRAESLNEPRFKVASDEPLVMYVKGHGVSVIDNTGTAQPMLLCGNEYRPGSSAGQFNITNLIKFVGKIDSPLKLIILDCNHLSSDLRLKMSANLFAAQVGEFVSKTNDPQLWVLLSSGALQVSVPNHERGLSRFATAVTDGLTFVADSSEDRKVSLAEFYTYVLQEVASRSVMSPGGPALQTPILLHAGSASPVSPEDVSDDAILVARVTEPPAPEDGEEPAEKEPVDESQEPAAEDKDGGEKQATRQFRYSPIIMASMLMSQVGPQNSKPATDDGQTQSDDAGQPNAGPGTAQTGPPNEKSVNANKADTAPPGSPTLGDPKKSDESKAANDPPAPDETPDGVGTDLILKQLEKAAAYRRQLVADPLQIQGGRIHWSPLAFAPHLVKRIDQRLHEAEYRSIFLGVNESSDVEGLVSDLEFITTGRAASAVRSGDSPALQRAIKKFENQSAEFNSDLDQALKIAEQDEKVAKRLDDLVRYWNLYMSTAYRLPFYVQWHDDLSIISHGGSHASFDNVASLIDRLKRLRERLESDLRNPGRDIESAAVDVENQRDLIDANIKEACSAGVAPAIEAAIRTPIPDRSDRDRARSRLLELAVADPAIGKFAPAALAGDSWQWDRALDRLKLHARMLRLVRCSLRKNSHNSTSPYPRQMTGPSSS